MSDLRQELDRLTALREEARDRHEEAQERQEEAEAEVGMWECEVESLTECIAGIREQLGLDEEE